jgi:uroporphyrinogen-III decarboxylase
MAVGFVYSTDESKITELAGVALREYYRDLRLMVWAQERGHESIRRELGVLRQGYVLSHGHVVDAEAMGCRVFWPEDEEPMVAAPALSAPAEISNFRPVDPPDNPVARRELSRAKAFFELTGQKTSIGFNGPVTVASLCLGQGEFYALSALDTGLAEELARRVTAAVIAWKRYHDTEMDTRPEDGLGLADDSASFLSPPLFARLSLPYLKEWYEAFPGYDSRSLHICGDSTHFLGQLHALGLTSFDLGEMVDLAKAKMLLPRTYIWRIADFRVIRDGDRDEIETCISTDLTAGAPGGHFGIHVEGWRGVPLWKVRIVKDLIDHYNHEQGDI